METPALGMGREQAFVMEGGGGKTLHNTALEPTWEVAMLASSLRNLLPTY